MSKKIKHILLICALIFFFIITTIIASIPFYQKEDTLTINIIEIDNIELPERSIVYVYIECIKYCQANENSSVNQLNICYETCNGCYEACHGIADIIK